LLWFHCYGIFCFVAASVVWITVCRLNKTYTESWSGYTSRWINYSTHGVFGTIPDRWKLSDTIIILLIMLIMITVMIVNKKNNNSKDNNNDTNDYDNS